MVTRRRHGSLCTRRKLILFPLPTSGSTGGTRGPSEPAAPGPERTPRRRQADVARGGARASGRRGRAETPGGILARTGGQVQAAEGGGSREEAPGGAEAPGPGAAALGREPQAGAPGGGRGGRRRGRGGRGGRTTARGREEAVHRGKAAAGRARWPSPGVQGARGRRAPGSRAAGAPAGGG